MKLLRAQGDVQRRCSFLYMRGVFFVLFLLLICPSCIQAVHVGGELTATVGTDGAQTLVVLDVSKEFLGSSEVNWGFDLITELPRLGQTTITRRLDAQVSITSGIRLHLNRNQDHVTTWDTFRTISKNNYTEASSFVGLQSEQFRVGYLQKVPLRNRDVVDVIFAESNLDLGAFSLVGMQMRYAGSWESGTSDVLQFEGRLGTLEVLGAKGWQTDFRGEESQALVLELRNQGPRYKGSLLLQRIEPGFLSLLAKTNRYTPDRQGWQLELVAEHELVKITCKAMRQKNLDGTRAYRQLSFKLHTKDKHTSLEWRIEPTPAFLLGYEQGDTRLQLDPFNNTLRADLMIGGLFISGRLDAQRSIARLECRFERVHAWRFIAKRDFLRDLSHHSLLMEHGGSTGPHFQLEIGQYDRGNMSSGFDHPTTVRISWGWKF
jgi:hypothetical protein